MRARAKLLAAPRGADMMFAGWMGPGRERGMEEVDEWVDLRWRTSLREAWWRR